MFVCSDYDGDEILQDMTIKYKRNPTVNDELVLKTFTIKIVSIKDNGIICSMPLPTIDDSGYRLEPLARLRCFEHIQLRQTRTFKAYEEFETLAKNIASINLIEDYIKYIRVFVYEK
jgi:hypothetical protein